MTACPVCHGGALAMTIERASLPVLQNKVFDTREAALQSPQAPFRLATCKICGFAFNAAFDPRLVVYDEDYDNEVPSSTFARYYESLATQLIERFKLVSGKVIDVGCGKGAFLKTLCRLAPGIQGIGIDPSCNPVTDGNCTLIRDVFRPQYFDTDCKLVLLRHVLEHLAEPVQFLTALRSASPRTPLVVEVPDVNWIFRNGAFWDFCYEHSNYFSADSLGHALNRAGFSVQHHEYSFGEQYQWVACLPSDMRNMPPDPSGAIAAAERYANLEAECLSAARARIEDAGTTVVWGMATKGVIFSCLMQSDRIVGGIDINARKQGKFVPGSGVRVHAPEWLKTLATSPSVIVMNENYLDEIRATVESLGLRLSVAAI